MIFIFLQASHCKTEKLFAIKLESHQKVEDAFKKEGGRRRKKKEEEGGGGEPVLSITSMKAVAINCLNLSARV